MDEINVLFLNLSSENDEFFNDCRNTLNYLESLPNLELEIAISQEDVISRLAEFDVFLLWVNHENSDIWSILADSIDERKELNFLGFIVIFGFQDDVVEQRAHCAMLREIYAFACPFNYFVLKAYIEATALEMNYRKSLYALKNSLNEAKNLDDIVRITFEQLKNHPIIGYDRATISLVDEVEEGSKKRYLFRYNPDLPSPDRQLLKAINEDKLIAKVVDDTVIVIGNLRELREKNRDELAKLDWEDKGATLDVNSWVGIAAKHQDRIISIICLDSKTPGHYARYSDKLVRFLKDYSKIIADRIFNYSQERNARIFREVTNEIGDKLKSEELILQILLKLKYEFKCYSCTYFKVITTEKGTFLEEWVSTSNLNISNEQSEKKQVFRNGEGIVGAVLSDGKSRFIPYPLGSKEFIQIPISRQQASKLSLLAVPVVPYKETETSKPARVIGVISCSASETDYFTVYDRDLLENIAKSTASVIERTMTLEYSNDISSKMNELILNEDNANLLVMICEHALKVTNATAAYIHRLQLQNDGIYRLKGKHYTFPEDIEAEPPRLNGEGTTSKVILEKDTCEFSNKLNNWEVISEKQRKRGVKYQIVVPLLITNEEKQERQLIGAIYLVKKESEDPLSEAEKFALELFASQAASSIYLNEVLSEKNTWATANKNLTEAINTIANSEQQDLLLRDIVRNSYSLVGATFSYLALMGKTSKKKFDFKAAFPESILIELNEFHSKDDNLKKEDGALKKGIVRLAAEREETILIEDLHEEKKNDTDLWKEYIQFKKETRSELVVPIKGAKPGEIIGVINLEHEKPYAFNHVHKEVIEHFARQVAIAFQKKGYIEAIRNKNEMLTKLQNALQKILESPLQNMLHSAALLTKSALDAQEVVIIPIQKKQWYSSGIKAEKIVSATANDVKNLSKTLNKETFQVYNKQKLEFFSTKLETHDTHDGNVQKDIKGRLKKLGFTSGLCLPITSQIEIGVIWVFFNTSDNIDNFADEATFQVYANQIALAYTAAHQAEEIKLKNENDLSANITKDYDVARRDSRILFTISVLFALVGFVFIGYSLLEFIKTDSKDPAKVGIPAFIGLVLQTVTVLAFKQGREANERMDRYHEELYQIRKFNILVSEAEKLGHDSSQNAKQRIIDFTTSDWICSIEKKKVNEIQPENQGK